MAALLAILSAAGGCSDSQTPASPVQTVDTAGATGAAQDSALQPELARFFGMIQDGQADLARLHVQRYILENPDDGRGLFLFGLTFHVQHRYEQARVHFREALEKSPQFPPLHYFYGWCLYNLGETGEARLAFESHLKLQPDEPDSHFALGLIAMSSNDLDEAHHRFTRAIALYDPDNEHDLGRAYGKLGEVYVARGGEANLQQARQHLTTATELFPDDHESLYHLYRVLLQLGENHAAEQVRTMHEAARRRAGLPAPSP